MYMSTSTPDNSADPALDSVRPTVKYPTEPEPIEEDPEAAGNILRGNMMSVLVMGLAVLIGILALLLAT